MTDADYAQRVVLGLLLERHPAMLTAEEVRRTLSDVPDLDHAGTAFNELMYGAHELAFRAEEETRSTDGDLLMRSPFDEMENTSGAET